MFLRKVTLSLLSVLALVTLASAKSPGLDVATLKSWVIVTPEKPIPSEVYAAEEFQKYFEKISKVKLPIGKKAKPAGNIFIGQSEALSKSGLKISTKNLGQENLRIKITKDNIAIIGGRPRGTLYGVYEFLEKYFGVRFLTIKNTYIPSDAIKRKLPFETFYFAPVFSNRWSSYAETNRNKVFATKLRNNGPGRPASLGGKDNMTRICHSFFRQIPSSKYGKEHPEYYCLIGKHRKAATGGMDAKPVVGNQPCLTNPDVLRIVTQDVLNWIKKNPWSGNVWVAQNDNFFYCRCENCKAIDEKEESHCGTLLKFVNAVADEVAKKHPDVKVGTLIYQYSRKPPKNIKPRENVQLQLCSIECSQVYPLDDPNNKKNAEFCKDLKAWGKLSKDVRIWTYNNNFYNYLLPCPNLRNIEPNIRLFANNNVKGVYMQGAGNGMSAEFGELRNYVTSRLLWNPNLSGQELIDEFLDLHYGKAAPPIRKFINLYHDKARESGADKDCFASAADYGIDESVGRAGLKYFEEAMKLADNDVIRARVEKASMTAYRIMVEEAWEWMWWTENEVPRPRISTMPPALIKRTRPYASKLFKLCKKYGVNRWQEWFPLKVSEDLFKKSYGLKKGEEI